MNIQDIFREQHRLEKKERQKLTRKSFALYLADKWIDFLALIVAVIALIRTF